MTYVLDYSTDGATWTNAYSGTNTYYYATATINGTYSYRVKAIKTGYANSSYMTAGNSCAVTLSCGPPTSLTVPTSNTTGSIYVYWGSSNISGVTYVLQYSTDGTTWTNAYSGTNTYYYATATVNGNYSFRVKVSKTGYVDSTYTTAGNSCAVTMSCGAPSSLTVPSSNSTGSIYVYWGSSNISGVMYVLDYSTDGVTWTNAYSGTNTYYYAIATTNGAYTFRVKAIKSGYADSSYTTAGNSCAVTLSCGPPTSLTVPTSNTTGSIYVYWGSSNISGVTYVLDYSTDGVTWTNAYSGANTYFYATATVNGNYTFRVKATKTGYADSTYTTASNGCAVALSCGAPSSLTVPSSNTTGSIYVYWGSSNISGVTYALQYSTDGTTWTNAYSGTNTYYYAPATANGTYSFRVKATRTGYADSAYTTAGNSCAVTLH